jgi:hypothetical protein
MGQSKYMDARRLGLVLIGYFFEALPLGFREHRDGYDRSHRGHAAD